MDRIGDIIGKRLNQHKLGENARASLVLKRANNFLHSRLRCTEEEVNAFRLKDGVLYVGTYGATWSQEVFHHQEALIKEVRKDYGDKSILKIMIKSLTSSSN